MMSSNRHGLTRDDSDRPDIAEPTEPSVQLRQGWPNDLHVELSDSAVEEEVSVSSTNPEKESPDDKMIVDGDRIEGSDWAVLFAMAIRHSEPWANSFKKLAGLAIILYSKPSRELGKLLIEWLSSG